VNGGRDCAFDVHGRTIQHNQSSPISPACRVLRCSHEPTPVGFAAKQVPTAGYNYMTELHNSPDQRRMIAEINAAYTPALVVLDAVQAFTTAGPDTGTLVEPGVIIAGTDRIAVDAVGVALLRHYGTTPEVTRGPIFRQEQIARAVQLGLGVSAPEQIHLVTDDTASAEFATRIETQLHG
jgi:uncharacterized protein (DUF362 family)